MIDLADEIVSPDMIGAIDAAARPFADELGIDAIVIAADHDHDGAAVINARVRHRLTTAGLSAASLIDLERAIRHAVSALGERRFVHVGHDFAERQQLIGLDAH